MMSPAIRRFATFALVGGSTFAFDLVLLSILADVIHVDVTYAAGIAFAIAVSINYVISRKLVFKGTKRSVETGYLYFLLIAGTGLVFVMGAMYVLVHLLSLHYLISRVCIAGVTGFWNYLTNLYFNFKIAGKH